ncbi:MAG: hypothetical protein ACTS47_01555 [Candidatus Hodgkinia cicadicola]
MYVSICEKLRIDSCATESNAQDEAQLNLWTKSWKGFTFDSLDTASEVFHFLQKCAEPTDAVMYLSVTTNIGRNGNEVWS